MIDRESDVRVGLLLLAAHEARLVEWSPRTTEEVSRIDLAAIVGDERELRGPSAAHPRGAPGAAPGSHSGQQRDLHEQRLDKHRVAAIEGFAVDAAREAPRRAWPLIVVLGDPRLTHPAARELRQRGVRIEESDRNLGWMRPAELARAVADDVERALDRVAAASRTG